MIRKTLIVAIGTALVAVACGNDDVAVSATPEIVVEPGDATAGASDESAAADTTDGASALDGGASDEEAALAFTQCLRDEGLDIADPVVDADGSIQLNGGNQQPPAAGDDEGFQEAFDACGDLLDGTSLLPSIDDVTDNEDAFLEFAQCLRDNDVDVDDPDLSVLEGGPGAAAGMFGDEFDPDDPEAADAIEACQDILITAFGGAG